MMASPSRTEFDSDAVPTGVLSSHSNVPISSDSDHSDIITDPVQLEREIAHEVLKHDSDTNKPDDVLKMPTISYEEALERELKYQKRIKMVLLQHSAANVLPHNPSQEPPSEQSILGVKRKAVCRELAEESRIRSPRPPQPWPIHPPTWQQTPRQKPPLPRPISKKPLGQGFSKPLQGDSQGEQTFFKRQHNFEETPLWCDMCMVKCGNPQNLMSHVQGKKHKANLDAAIRSNMISMSNNLGDTSQPASSGCQKEPPSIMKRSTGTNGR